MINEIALNGARVETDHDAIFDRMGLNWVRQNLFFEQRQRPLGGRSELPELQPQAI